jgi:hypothetical protein
MDKVYVMDVLIRNGIDKKYLDENDNWIELGDVEWMNMLSEVVGKNSYECDNWSDSDNERVMEFRRIIEEELEIECY